MKIWVKIELHYDETGGAVIESVKQVKERATSFDDVDNICTFIEEVEITL